MRIEVTLDGEPIHVDAEPRRLLVDFLRGRGPRIGCDTSHCGACAVLLDGRAVKSCTVLAVQAAGRRITTIPTDAPASAGLQRVHADEGGGCGFCLPGMTAAVATLPEPVDADDVRRAISGNLCRCTGYHALVRAAVTIPDAREGRRPEPTFVGDVVLEGAAHLAVLRSPLAHAGVRSVNVSSALDRPGVLMAITADDLGAALSIPTAGGERRPVLAIDRVLFQGQEVAAIVAKDPYEAQDALESIAVDYDPLPPAIGASRDVVDESYRWTGGDPEATDRAMARADEVIEIETSFPRVHGAPLETTSCVAAVVRGGLVVHATVERPEETRETLTELLGEPVDVRVPAIGGGFGTKAHTYPGYVLAAWAARRLGRPVRWLEPRSEHQVATAFAGDVAMRGMLAVDGTGRMLALHVEADCDHGAYLMDGEFPERAWLPVTGPYDLAAAHVTVNGFRTNTTPGGMGGRTPDRSAEGCLLVEQLIDVAASRLGMDPAEIRRRNLVPPDGSESRSPLGLRHDPVRYRWTLEMALSKIRYEELRAEQADSEATLGVGIACFIAGEAPPLSFGTCVAAIDLDPPTGGWHVRRMVVLLDVGSDGSPVAVDGLDGDAVAGFGAAALERIEYDEDGNSLGSTFLDYLVPGALEAPPVEVVSAGGPLDPAMARGLAAVGPPAALANAVADALARRGAPPVDLPMTAAAVWDALHGSGAP